MRRLRLTPSASIVAAGDGVLLRSDLRTFRLDGRDVGTFLESLVPLLDGTRDAEEIAASLAGYSRDSVSALLELLSEHGLVQEIGEGAEDQDAELARRHREFFAQWGPDPIATYDRLARSRVAFVGLEPWGAIAAQQLARTGLGRLWALDDGPLAPGESVELYAEPPRGARGESPAPTRAQALAEHLASGAPRCAVHSGASADLERLLADRELDLVIVSLPLEHSTGQRRVATAVDAHRVPALYAHMDGLDAVLGPLVIPGQTPCWNCYRLRRLANTNDVRVAVGVQASLASAAPAARAHPYPTATLHLLGSLLASEATKLLSGYAASGLAGRILAQNVVTLSATLHGIIRLPWCEVCGGAARRRPAPGERSAAVAAEDADDEEADPDLASVQGAQELRARLPGWIDARTGIIRDVSLVYPAPPGPELPYTASATLAAHTDGWHVESWEELASGKGLTPGEALIGAVGEAIERYSASRYRREELIRGSFEACRERAIDPRQLSLYEAWQYEQPGFPFAPFKPEEPIDWALGRWLDTGEEVLVPALLTFYNYRAPEGEWFAQASSNGLAAGADLRDAELRATLELVERDAFVLTWLARLPGRRLLADGLDPRPLEVIRQLRQCGAEVELALLDAGAGIPVVASLGFGDGESWPGLTIALAAHPDPRIAAVKAIVEQGQVGPYVRRLMLHERLHERRSPVPRPADVRTLQDHALYYARPERQALAQFMLDGGEVSLAELSGPPPGTDLHAHCTGALGAAGLRVATVEVTAPDVRTGPFRVARAVGLHMQPIHFGHGWERLANPRLRELAPTGINPDPHPLA